MGLKLSVWLYGSKADSPLSSSSTFPALAVPTCSRLSVILHSTPVGPGDDRSHWSFSHCSPHFLISACQEKVTRTPVEQSSDGVRAERGVRSGLHLWEMLWNPTHRGSHAVIGISSQNCPLQASGYKALVGGDTQSWGWELGTNQLWHGGRTLGMYPGEKKKCHSQGAEFVESQPFTSSHIQTGLETPASPLPVPERVVLVLDADAGTLGYIVDGCFLGVAFKDLPREVDLFPAVSSVRGGATVRLRYLNGAERDPPALMALSRLSIRQSLGKQRQNLTDRLPLPPILQRYLLPSQ
ncbi:SPRY domain-containing SOCS box protein 2 [Polymixia lowei]